MKKRHGAGCHPDRVHCALGLCKPCYDTQYQQKHRERHNANARRWAADNPEKRLAVRRRYHYGIEPDVVRARLNAQEGLCKICQVVPAVHLDHNHKNGQTRGLLCGNCNRGLGLMNDNPEQLRRAADYIELWAALPVVRRA